MLKIKSVFVSGFWGKHKINASFHDDVNIIIGKNGSGKTTLINLVESTLTADLTTIEKIDFEYLEIVLGKQNNINLISVKKSKAENLITYKIDNVKYEINGRPTGARIRDVISDEYQGRELNERIFYSLEHRQLYEKLCEMVEIIWLSVNRQSLLGNRIKHDGSSRLSTVDDKLFNLIDDFISFKLGLESAVREISTKFEKDVFRSMLFNEKIDKLDEDLFNGSSEQFMKERNGLYRAFDLLNILDEDVKSKIDAHIIAINNSFEKFKEDSLTIDDVFPIALLARTEHLVELTIDIEYKKKLVYEPLVKFQNILSKFIDDKEFYFTNNRFRIIKDKKPLSIINLSSGEKQILILLIESLLKKNKNCIYIADEPELSLHIEWQEIILPSLRELNNNAQILVATHSPEIAANYPDCIINMENIING